MSRRRFIGRSAGTALAIGGVGSFLAACGGDDSGSSGGGGGGGEVVVITWGGAFLGKDVTNGLYEATGIRLKPVPGESDVDFFNKVKSGGRGQYDVVIGNAGYSPLFFENGLVEELDYADFASTKQMYPEFLESEVFPYVRGNGRGLMVPNTWGAYAMHINTTAPDAPAPPYKWTQLWDAPKGKVLMGAAPDTVVAIGGLGTGVPLDQVFSMEGATLDRVEEHLIELTPLQLATSDQFTIDAFRTGRATIGSSFGLGTGTIINERAGKDMMKSVIPEEGGVGTMDGMMLVKDAPNRENALKFIDYFAGEKNQLFIWDEFRYASCNKAAMDAVVARGGEQAAFAKAISATDPSVAESLVQERRPDDPQAYADVWDRVRTA